MVTNSCEGTLACKEKCVSIQGETITDPLPNCSPRLLQTLSRLSHVQVNQLHLWGERGTKCYPRCTAVSTGPANGAFMLAVLSLLHPCVWENRHECTIVSIFNHRLNDRSVKKLRDRQITQREMLQQFPNMRLSVCVCVCLFPVFFLLFLYQCLCSDFVWVATPISQENTATAEWSKHRSGFVMTLLRQARQSDQLSEYPGTLKHVGPSSLPHGVRATVVTNLHPSTPWRSLYSWTNVLSP